jgi:DNA-binding HxlR family transcriptional regulator
VRVDYTLSEAGQALLPVVCSIAEWAETWLPMPDPQARSA